MSAQGQPQSVLYVFSTSPFDSRRAHDGLEMLMASSAFDIEVAAAFVHSGVQCLLNEAEPLYLPFSDNEVRSSIKPFRALPDLGVEGVLVFEQSMLSHGLSKADLSVDATLVDRDGLAAAMRDYDVVLIF